MFAICPAPVIHVGASSPSTNRVKVLSATSPPAVALTTKVDSVLSGTSVGTPAINPVDFICMPAGNLPEWNEYFTVSPSASVASIACE